MNYSAAVVEQHPLPSAAARAGRDQAARGGVRGFAGAAAMCLVAAALAWALHWVLDTASLVLLFLLAVVLTAVRYGRGPASLAAAMAVLLFNLMFVPPRYSFAVADEQFFFTFAVMLSVGLLVGQLTAGLRAQAEAARAREQQVRSLYDISRELGGALTAPQVADALARFARLELAADATLWVRGRSGALLAFGADPDGGDAQRAAALMAASSPGCAPIYDAGGRSCLLPLEATMAVRGAMALRRADA